MEGLSVAASIIAVVQITQSLSALLRDLYRDVRNARAEIEQLYDSIVTFEIIAKGLDDLMKRRSNMVMNPALLEDPQGPLNQALSELKEVKEKLEVQTIDGRFEKKRFSVGQSVKRSLKWPFKKGEVMTIVERVKNYKSNLMMDATVNNLSLQFDHSDILGDIRKDIAIAQNSSHRQQLLNWLSKPVPDPSFQHNYALKRYEEATGSWLLDGNDLKEWLITPNSFLGIYGNAGSGKSTLCSAIISHVQEKCKIEPNSVVVYWYFTFRDLASQKVDQCLRSLVTNLCSKRRDTPQVLQEAYEQANNGQLSPSTKSLMAMLHSVIDGFEDVYIFLDALDECPKSDREQEREREELLNRIHQICSWNKDCLHIITTSRKERDIEESFTGLSMSHNNFKIVAFQGAHVEEDIKKYIRAKFKSSQFKNWSPGLKKEAEIKLASQADGMFRLVALQVDVLLKSASLFEIRKALDALPTSLDSFYDRVLNEINEHDKNRACLALQWLAFSARPLSLSELSEAVIIQSRKNPCFDPDERFLDENQLLEILPAGLVTKILRKQPFEDGRQTSRVHEIAYVEFAHFSVLEYLKSSRMSPELRSSYQIEETKAHSMIAESCLAYLLSIGRMEQVLAERISKLLRKASNEDILSEWAHLQRFWTALDDAYALAAYTTRAWQFHLSRLEQVENEYMNTLALEFLNDTSNSWIIWRFFSFEESTLLYYGSVVSYASRSDSIEIVQIEPKIHPVTWISFLGLSTLLKLLLTQSPCLPNLERTPGFGSPLHAAATAGNLQIVQILLSALEDPNEQGGYYGTPLIAASRRRCSRVVKLLLKSGADVNANFKGKTPLISASEAGSAELVKLLLDSGAEINANWGRGTALIGAAKEGHLEVTKLLLESGADVNAQEGYQTALVAASKRVRVLHHSRREAAIQLVKLLVEAGADDNGYSP